MTQIEWTWFTFEIKYSFLFIRFTFNFITFHNFPFNLVLSLLRLVCPLFFVYRSIFDFIRHNVHNLPKEGQLFFVVFISTKHKQINYSFIDIKRRCVCRRWWYECVCESECNVNMYAKYKHTFINKQWSPTGM